MQVMVAKGQIIARFDQTDALADFEDTKAKAASLSANLSRLEAEIYGNEPIFTEETEEYPQFVKANAPYFQNEKRRMVNSWLRCKKFLALVKKKFQ